MINIYSKKNNALNYAIAFFSGLTFLGSGMAIAFPSAVLSLGLLVPLIAVCGVLSLTAFVLAGQAVSNNKVISETLDELTIQEEEITNLKRIIAEKNTVSKEKKVEGPTTPEAQTKSAENREEITGVNGQQTQEEPVLKHANGSVAASKTAVESGPCSKPTETLMSVEQTPISSSTTLNK